ncbi:MAG: FAD-dependent oxidoreductase [Clostridia bacterium]|nr:FAD-dependent oxidoreductase [Clostridia bacterium]
MKKVLSFVLAAMMLFGISFTAMAEDKLADGEYTTVCHGFYGDFDLKMTVKDGAIAGFDYSANIETPELGGKALELMSADMVANNTCGVDSVSGATVTSAMFRVAVAGLLKEIGAPAEMSAQVVKPAVTDETLKTDVLVIGSGAAGLAAASGAAESGAKVVLLEKQDILGGSFVTSAGIVYAAMDEADVEPMVAYYQMRANGKANEDLLRFFAENSRATIAWLEGLGTQWGMVVPAGLTGEPRAHFAMDENGRMMAGAVMSNKIVKHLEDLGVTILTGTPATELIADANGAVVGAKAVSDTKNYTIEAGAVILATGGFDASSEMKSQWSPSATEDFPLSSKGNTGDGINMGIAVGAATDFKGGMIGFDFVDGSLPESGYNAVAMYCNSYVQPDGTFVSDVIDYPVTYRAIKDLGVEHFYGLYDAKGADTVAASLARGYAWKGETVEELAAATGMDAAKLADAIARGTGLESAPYFAVMVKPCTIGSMGGLVIDTDAQVISVAGAPIAGLYASGEVANGQFYDIDYPASGSSNCISMTFGLEAGRNAAAYAAK